MKIKPSFVTEERLKAALEWMDADVDNNTCFQRRMEIVSRLAIALQSPRNNELFNRQLLSTVNGTIHVPQNLYCQGILIGLMIAESILETDELERLVNL